MFLFLITLVNALISDYSDNLVRVFKFDGDCSDSLGNEDCTLVNAPTSVNGIDGSAYSFGYEDNKYIDSNWQNQSMDKTASMWFNITSIANSGVWFGANGGDKKWAFGWVDSLGSMGIYLGNTANYCLFTPTVDFWYNFVFTYVESNKSAYLYANGTVICSATDSDTVDANYDYYIGGLNDIGSSSDQYYGLIDEVIMWNCTLSDEAISELQTYFYSPPVDASAPTFLESSINNSNPKINENILLSQKVQDDIGIDWIRIAHNQSGDMVNQSLEDISGISYNYTYPLTITLPKNNVISYQFWVNDTSGNANTSEISTITVVNTPPPIPQPIRPIVNGVSRFNDIPFYLNVTFGTDADNDILTIYYYINGTLNGTSTENLSIDISDGYYLWNVSLYDGEDFNYYPSATYNNFIVDKTNPIPHITSPTATTYNTNITVNMTCTDLSPYLLNYTFYNSTNEMVISEQNGTPQGNTLGIFSEIDITLLADGNYIFNYSCSDSHTDITINDYDVKSITNGLEFITDQDNDIKIIQQSEAIVSTKKKEDRYQVNFGISLETEIRKYRIIADKPIYIIENSNYKGHIVILNGNKGNWVDFENEDPKSTVTVARISEKEVEATVTSKNFNFKSIGGLNVVSGTIPLTIDTSIPEIQEEDSVFSAVLLLGTFGLLICFIIIMIMALKNSFKGGKK